MLTVAATSFAQSPAGWISGIVLPAALGVIVTMNERNRRRNDDRLEHIESTATSNAEKSAERDQELSIAMTTNTQALAIIVERIAPMQTAISQNTSKAMDLDKAVAVLQHAMNSHEAWAQQTRDELRSEKRA